MGEASLSESVEAALPEGLGAIPLAPPHLTRNADLSPPDAPNLDGPQILTTLSTPIGF